MEANQNNNGWRLRYYVVKMVGQLSVTKAAEIFLKCLLCAVLTLQHQKLRQAAKIIHTSK